MKNTPIRSIFSTHANIASNNYIPENHYFPRIIQLEIRETLLSPNKKEIERE
jgi:hypothetical protein